MPFLSPPEREQARACHLALARHSNSCVTIPAGPGAELVFHFNDDWVEGHDIEGQPVRLKLSELTRFDIDQVTQEGDDKTHFFFYLLLEGAGRRLVYYDREPDYVYNPIPGLTRKDLAELNLGALVHLANLEVIRSEFAPLEPWRAFRQEGETGPPRTPEERARQEQTAGIAGFALLGALALAAWLLFRRWPRF